MPEKRMARIAAIASIGLIGAIAAVFCGLSALNGLDIPNPLTNVIIAVVSGLSGWLNQPNGHDGRKET